MVDFTLIGFMELLTKWSLHAISTGSNWLPENRNRYTAILF